LYILVGKFNKIIFIFFLIFTFSFFLFGQIFYFTHTKKRTKSASPSTSKFATISIQSVLALVVASNYKANLILKISQKFLEKYAVGQQCWDNSTFWSKIEIKKSMFERNSNTPRALRFFEFPQNSNSGITFRFRLPFRSATASSRKSKC